jgi:hypothetical protein
MSELDNKGMKKASHHSLEAFYRVYNDQTGEHFSIGPDADGLEMVEIMFVDANSKIGTRLQFNEEQLPLIIRALQMKLDEYKMIKGLL